MQILSEGPLSGAWSLAGRKGKGLEEELRGKDREARQECILGVVVVVAIGSLWE